MTPERWSQIERLYHSAREQEPGERDGFLKQACAGDEELRREVKSLLAYETETATLMDPPILELAARALGVEQPMLIRTHPASREGCRVGDYEILRELGRGGMGSVYLGRRADETFHKDVAIKILLPDKGSGDVVQRFHREREILAQLDHPNVARLLDAGQTDDGLPYFVMEYVQGRSIEQYADQNRLRVCERLVLFRQVCDAVDYAHQRKVVHRDLKPGNMLVTADGQVKLLDFGIARLIEQDAGAADLTQVGAWLMTPEYASPEQVRGEAAERASDVYSLGVILFELVTGHRPYHFRRRIFHEIVRVVCEEPPRRPSAVIALPIETTAEGKTATLPPEAAGSLRQTSIEELKRELTGNLDDILLKALNKRPEDRYGSVQDLRADIERHLNGEPVRALGGSHSFQIGKLLTRYRVALVLIAAVAAAVATGTVQMQWSALWWVTGAAMVLGLWQAAMDPATGRRIAASWPMSHSFWIVILVGLDLFWIIGPHWIGRVLMAALTLAGIILVGERLTRQQRSGPLVLDLPYVPGAVRFLAILGPLGWLRTLAAESADPDKFLRLAFWTAWSILFLVGLGSEIRRDGFIRGGRLISWGRIASWNWDLNVLALQLYRRIQFLPPVRIRIRTSQKARVQAILARQLSEWSAPWHREPVGTSKSSP